MYTSKNSSLKKTIYEKALEYQVLDSQDWRYYSVENIRNRSVAVYEAEVLLDSTTSNEDLSYLDNYSGFIFSETTDDVLEAFITDTNNAIEKYWETIEKNDNLKYHE